MSIQFIYVSLTLSTLYIQEMRNDIFTLNKVFPSPSSEEKLAWCLLGWAVVQMCVNVPIQAMYPACSDQPQNFYFIAIVWHLLYWILLFILVLNQGYPAKWKQNIEQVQKVDIGRSIENLESKSFLC